MKRVALVCAACAVFATGVARAEPPGSRSVEGRVLVNPLIVVAVAPSSVRAGVTFPIGAVVANLGPTPLQNVAVTLVAPPGLALRTAATQVLPLIGARRLGAVLWSACSATPGSYIVLVRVVTGPFQSESAGALINVTPAPRARC